MSKLWFSLEAAFELSPDEGDPATFDMGGWLDTVVDHLYDLGARDVGVVADEGDRTFSVSLLLDSLANESIETVVGKGMGLLRTAFHARDAGTPGWPSLGEAFRGMNVVPAIAVTDLGETREDPVQIPA